MLLYKMKTNDSHVKNTLTAHVKRTERESRRTSPNDWLEMPVDYTILRSPHFLSAYVLIL